MLCVDQRLSRLVIRTHRLWLKGAQGIWVVRRVYIGALRSVNAVPLHGHRCIVIQ
jgi:hypothetical protein